MDRAKKIIKLGSDKKIAPGITVADIEKAIKKSGFPLQTLMATYLSKSFYVQEEWPFIDSDSAETRTLDIFANRMFFKPKDYQSYARPELNMLIECKQSESPYVFFLSTNSPATTDFPLITGLHNSEIELKTDEDRSTHVAPLIECLGLSSHPFISGDIPSAMSFSKYVQNGKMELQGDEPFRNIVLPLVKGIRHFKDYSNPPSTALYFDCGITLGVVLIDAPLLGVLSNENKNEISELNWVRVFKRTSENAEYMHDRSKCFAIDVISKDFLEEYLEKNLIPFMELFSKRVIKHQKVIATGKGFVPGLNKRRGGIETRLKPR